MSKKKFSKISAILQDAKRGKMFVLVDDEKRENEGDLVIPASKVTAQSINFMAKYGRGLICLALSQSQVNKLNLSLMSPINSSRTQTAFTVSIDARDGISSGIRRFIGGKSNGGGTFESPYQVEVKDRGHFLRWVCAGIGNCWDLLPRNVETASNGCSSVTVKHVGRH